MSERPCLNVKVERSLAFTFTHDFIHCLHYNYARTICVRTLFRNFATVEIHPNTDTFGVGTECLSVWSEMDLRRAGVNSRCPFYRGVRLLEMSVKSASTGQFFFFVERATCFISFCYPFAGSCTCRSGFFGQFCDKPCSQGFWGQNCSMTCSCVNGALCNSVNGQCTCRTADGCQCSPGWTGSDCSKSCNDSSWGSNCQNVCQCQHNGICNQVCQATILNVM